MYQFIFVIILNYLITFGLSILQNSRSFGFIVYWILNLAYLILVCRNSNQVIDWLEFTYEHVRNHYIKSKIDTMKTLQMVLWFFFGLRIMWALYELYIPIDNYSEYIQALTIVEESIMSMIIFMLLYLLRAQPYSQAYDEINIELIQLLIKSKFILNFEITLL